MFAAILFKKEPFFHGESHYDQLIKITKILGTEGLFEYLEKFHIEFNELDKLNNYKRKPWSSLITNNNKDIVNAHAIDLLDKMLIYDHSERILPCEALQHD